VVEVAAVTTAVAALEAAAREAAEPVGTIEETKDVSEIDVAKKGRRSHLVIKYADGPAVNNIG
jgi:hypothetical protein